MATLSPHKLQPLIALLSLGAFLSALPSIVLSQLALLSQGPSSCARVHHNLTFTSDVASSLSYTGGDVNLTFFFNCSDDGPWGNFPQNMISCLGYNSERISYIFRSTCEDVVVPLVLLDSVINRLLDLTYRFSDVPYFGFQLTWIAGGSQRKKSKTSPSVESFIQKYGSLNTKWYRYSEVKRMTKSFADKLGQGGFGIVYKGSLPNGHLVAVKILTKSKENGEEFINEVASISRTSHVNIVRLLGFCLDGSRQALIYDFMPNGSLERFIFNDMSQIESALGWNKLFEIVVGVARG
uniref:non-specific serine/threonine protein kinase n=1 Tax=Ananas comosus var. bracteatus TaxID=296719 RepID=A0A6V7NY36_ANACO|nr:unnamed protein product [Ananas comosus var. bracteatus]